MPRGISDPRSAPLPEGANLYLLMGMIEVAPSVTELQRYLSIPGNPTGAEAQEKLLEALKTAGGRLFLPSSP